MKTKHTLTAAALFGWAAVAVFSEEITEAQRKKIEQKLAGTYNPLSFYDGKLIFDVQDRLRFEYRENNFDFNDATDHVTDDAWLLQRFRVGALYKPTGWLKFYAQAQDSRELDSDRPDVPFVVASEGNDTFDLRQAWVEIGDLKQFPLTLKLGRQELIYGDERLIGAFDWNNLARTFDAVKIHFEPKGKKFWVDAFYANVVTMAQNTQTDNCRWQFNESNTRDDFLGVYASTTLLPLQTTEAYLLYRGKEGNAPFYSSTTTTPAFGNAPAYDIDQEIWTLGARVKSTPGKLNGFDYEFEGAYQFGKADGQSAGAYPGPSSLDHEAFALHLGGGYTFANVWSKPRIGIEYNLASGDTNPTDGKNESFLNLFHTNHKFYGYMDVFAWKNLHNPAIQLKFTPYQDSLQPFKALTVQLDYHLFWLFTNEDAWYRANAITRVRPLNAAANNANRNAGSEFDLTVGYAPTKWLKFLAGYSHYFAGDYLTDTGAADDADFVYVQTIIQF